MQDTLVDQLYTNQGPSLQLYLIKGPSNKHTLKGDVEVLLVNCNNDNEYISLISDKNCVVTAGKKIISETKLPMNTQVNNFFRDDGIVMSVSFKPKSEISEFSIGLAVLVAIIVVHSLSLYPFCILASKRCN